MSTPAFLHSSRLNSKSISASDTKVSMLLSFQHYFSQHKDFIMLFLFFFLVMVSNFLIIPVVKEKNQVKLWLAIPTGIPTMLVKEMIDTAPLVALKTIKILSM